MSGMGRDSQFDALECTAAIVTLLTPEISGLDNEIRCSRYGRFDLTPAAKQSLASDESEDRIGLVV